MTKEIKETKEKKQKEVEPFYSDILEEYFYDEKSGLEKVKKIYMDGHKKIREEILNS